MSPYLTALFHFTIAYLQSHKSAFYTFDDICSIQRPPPLDWDFLTFWPNIHQKSLIFMQSKMEKTIYPENNNTVSIIPISTKRNPGKKAQIGAE